MLMDSDPRMSERGKDVELPLKKRKTVMGSGRGGDRNMHFVKRRPHGQGDAIRGRAAVESVSVSTGTVLPQRGDQGPTQKMHVSCSVCKRRAASL